MNTSIILGAAGLATGSFIPKTTHWIVEFKNRTKILPTREKRFPQLLIFLICFLNTIVWALAGLMMNNTLSAVLVSILFTTTIVIAFIDIRIRIIPNELVLLILVVGGAYQVSNYGIKALLGSLLCMLGMMFLFTITASFVGFDKVGAGDVKLAGAMGLSLGYPSIVTALIVLCVSIFIYSLVGILIKKLTLESMLPFGPFMTMGMAVALLCTVFQILPSFLATL